MSKPTPFCSALSPLYYDRISDNQLSPTRTKMVLKIYGAEPSTCVRRVAVVAKFLDIPYELVGVDFANAEHKSENYIKNFHPFGRIPVAFDGDLRIIGT